MKKRSRILIFLIILFSIGIGVVAWLALQEGFSARATPSSIEAFVARRVRRLATPRRAREAKNPIPATREVLAEAKAHFADHCAICHDNDGSGKTIIGQGLYPKPPDLRQSETQSLSDGELFFIIHNGIRLSGMPAFGEETGTGQDVDSWKLVHFIRHLPKITHAELKEMEKMNPKSQMEKEQEEEMNKFLRGKESQPVEPKHKH